MTMQTVQVTPEQMEHYVETLGQHGLQPEGGIIRPVFGPAWVSARRQLADWMEAAGLAVREDPVGNLFGRLRGDADERTILTGSHVDTVKLGGKFDGALGVLAALAALGALRAQRGKPKRSLEMVALCEEEGSRFHAQFWGTRGIHGLIRDEELEALRDDDGTTIAEAMRQVGLDPSRVAEASRDDVDAFVELHIEQGRILYDEGVQLGVVDTITGIVQQQFVVTGRTDHAGTTPMDLRRDALQGAVLMAAEITRLAEAIGRPAVATTGQWAVLPGAFNIVPGEAHFSLDVRHPLEPVRRQLIADIDAMCDRIAAERGLAVTYQTVQDILQNDMDPSLRSTLRTAADAFGYTHKPMVSGAGHDSQVWARFVPTAMLFVPSVEGRSHSKAEFTHPQDAARGASVLATALGALAY